jgi:hypothetical protein
MKPIIYKRHENTELEITWCETALEHLPEGELRDRVQAELVRLRSSLTMKRLPPRR